ILGNRIGTDAAGATAVGNELGVLVTGNNVVIGGSAAGAGNVISGSTGLLTGMGHGIDVAGPADGTQILGNRIGTNAAGSAAIRNTRQQIIVRNGATNTTIGG